MTRWRSPAKWAVLFAVGGTAYVLIELLWRGRSHWSMAVVGGLCFLLIGAVNERFPWELPLLLQGAIGAAAVTAVELAAGLVVNVWLGWGVWDYSAMPLNFMGQICLPYTLLWIPLSMAGAVLDDWLRYWWFAEERPRYTLIRRGVVV